MICERVQVPSSDGAMINMDVYVPDPCWRTKANVRRPAIVICPGGGYRFCSEREAEPIALRFATEGFNTFVVWYRVALRGEDKVMGDCYASSPDHKYPMPQHDAAACLAYVRANADKYMTDPDRIAIMGFSAGGHLAASVSGLWQNEELWQPLGLKPQDVRPNAAVLCYPVIVADKDAHRGSFEHLSGSENVEEHQQYSILNWVTENYPPTFLWHTFSDGSVPVQNSIRMAHALAEKNVLTELHIFPNGPHGLSLCNDTTAVVPEEVQPDCECWAGMAARFLHNAM